VEEAAEAKVCCGLEGAKGRAAELACCGAVVPLEAKLGILDGLLVTTSVVWPNGMAPCNGMPVGWQK
jgi:hypothetical protein